MSTVIVTEPETETSADDAVEEVADAVEEIADAVDDAQSHAIDINHAERLTALELVVTGIGEAVTGLAERVETLASSDRWQDERINAVAEEVAEVATGAADAIQETVAEVEEASAEITPDEIPATRTHWFFRKWGRSG